MPRAIDGDDVKVAERRAISSEATRPCRSTAGSPRAGSGGRERIALVEPAALQAPLEPLHALSARAVGERVRRHVALCASLQPIVADRRGGAERLLHVALLQDLPRALRVMRPQAG